MIRAKPYLYLQFSGKFLIGQIKFWVPFWIYARVPSRECDRLFIAGGEPYNYLHSDYEEKGV